MTDFVNKVNSNEVANTSNQLYNAGDIEKKDFKYNPNTNQYEYTLEGTTEPKVALYSTADLLNYYFGNHLEDVQNNNKIYIITTSNDIDIILYGQKVIGYGIHNNEQTFTEGVQNFIKEKIRDYAEGKAKEYLNIPDNNVTESMKASVNLWKAFEAVSNESGIKPSDYAKALKDLGKLVNKFDYFYDESVIDQYISSMFMEIERDIFMKILDEQINGHSGVLDLSEGLVTEGIYKDYYKWCEEHKYDVVEYVDDCAGYDMWSYGEDKKTIIPNNIDMSEIAETTDGFVQKHIKPSIGDCLYVAWNILINPTVNRVQKSFSTARNTRHDPLILDLDGDGFNIETKENGTNFDLDKNGLAEKINWTRKDGILCLDLNGNGKKLTSNIAGINIHLLTYNGIRCA